MENKICCTCKLLLPITCFGYNKSNLDGLSKNCKLCKQKQRKNSYIKHRDSILLVMKTYYEKNKPKLFEYQKVWNNQNIEKVRIIKNSYNKRNRNKINKRVRENPEIYRKWEKENIDKVKEIRKMQRLRTVNKLYDSYIKTLLCRKSNLKHEDIPTSLVNSYKELIKIKRLVKQISTN